MKLLVVVLCLLSERYLIHAISFQRFNWFSRYYLWVKNFFDKRASFENPWLILLAILFPLVFGTSIIYYLFCNVFFGLFCLMFNLILFLYCLGPQNVFYPISEINSNLSSDNLVGNYFADVNRALFTMVFWYMVAGPIAIIIYRVITLSRDYEPVGSQANQITDIAEWIPARILALFFLLVGNFQSGFSTLVHLFLSKPVFNYQLLRDCGLKAVRSKDTEEISLSIAENLVERALIVFMVCLALVILLGLHW